MDESDIDAEDDTWDEDWGEVEGAECTSLFTDTKLPSAEACCTHDAKEHKFDLIKYISEHGLDDYGVIKCINFVRGSVAAGKDPMPDLASGPQVFADDRFLQPVLQDDCLLFHDFSLPADPSTSAEEGTGKSDGDRIRALEEENTALVDALQHLRLLMVPDELRDEAGRTGGASTSAAAQRVEPHARAAAALVSNGETSAKEAVDEAYFDSYSYFDIHREMLDDKVRTEAYRKALEENPALIKGARVLDIGCGTGILSLFAARAGAQQVVAVDGSERIASFAEKNCIANKLHTSVGGPITVVSGKVEDVSDLPLADGKADVLVSEWMGYALLFESMLASVLLCRDRWLKPGGAMLPDRAVIHVAAGSAAATGLDFWDAVYGFAFPAVRAEARKSTLSQPLVAPVPRSALLSASASVKEFDLTTMAAADADFSSSFELTVTTDGECHALVLWFDTPFSERFCAEAPCVLSTSPEQTQTHWVQTVFVLREPWPVKAGQRLACRCSFARSEQHRSIDISFEVQHTGGDGAVLGEQAQVYVMAVAKGADAADKQKQDAE